MSDIHINHRLYNIQRRLCPISNHLVGRLIRIMPHLTVIDELSRISEVLGPYANRPVLIGSAANIFHVGLLKDPRDIDLLVDPTDLDLIQSCLEADGYIPMEIAPLAGIHRVALAKDKRMSVDLYTKVSGPRQYRDVHTDSFSFILPSGSTMHVASFHDLVDMNRAAGRIE